MPARAAGLVALRPEVLAVSMMAPAPCAARRLQGQPCFRARHIEESSRDFRWAEVAEQTTSAQAGEAELARCNPTAPEVFFL